MPKKNTAKVTTLDYALLGLLKMAPSSGYQLRKIFATTPMAQYSSSPGAIYPALKRLESLKLITAKSEKGKSNRIKQTYRVTAAGTKSLAGWLRQPVSAHDLAWNLDVTLLRFSYLDLLDDRQLSLQFLEQFRAATIEREKQIKQLKTQLAPHQPLHGQLALQNGLLSIQTQAQWARDAIAQLKRQSGARVK